MDCVTAGMLCALPVHRRTTYHGNMNVKSNRRRLAKSPWSRSMYTLMRVTTAIACRRAIRLISLGPSLNDGWIEAGASSNRITILPNPINLSVPLLRAPQADLVLYVGRFSREKGGILELVQALALLPESVRMIVAGDGPLRNELEALIDKLTLRQRVELLGLQSTAQVENLYSLAALVVLPSVNEMLPRVMQEAWNAGLAYAGTPVGAVRDYLHDGSNGYVIPSTDPEDIARIIKRALSDPDERRRIEARARMSVQEMDLKRITDRLIAEVYEPVIAENRKRLSHSGAKRREPSSELMNRVHK
jgi:glycosyltransferase involved in cell wall biosynthesis